MQLSLYVTGMVDGGKMYFDAVTISAICDELNRKLLGGRVQAIIEMDQLTLGLEMYAMHARHYLVMSAHPQRARVLLSDEKVRRGRSNSSPLGLLMKKYLIGGRLESILQPSYERVIQFDFSGEEGDVSLVAEIMDNRSNIILMLDGAILESIKHVTRDMNRYREIIPKKHYLPPPPIQKKKPDEITASWIEGTVRGNASSDTWRILTQTIAGISPLLAREIVHRAGPMEPGDVTDFALRVAEIISEMSRDFSERSWEPGVCLASDGKKVIAYAAYRISSLPGWTRVGTMSEAVSAFFTQAGAGSLDNYAAGKETVREQIDLALTESTRKLTALQRELQDESQISHLRILGELILANIKEIPPKAESISAQYDFDQPPINVILDPDLSPLENAHEYFNKYGKAKKARENIPELIDKTGQVIDYLRQMSLDLSIAESWPEIDEVKEALIAGGFWKGKRDLRPKGGKPGLRRFVSPEGFVVLVGRNARQNHLLVTEQSQGEDLWLHAKEIPGSHVIIKSGGRKVPESVILFAAELAAEYSSARYESNIPVIFTKRKYVRPIKGAGPGMVTYRNEQIININPINKDD